MPDNVDIFLKMTGPDQKQIQGESKDAHFRGLVEIEDFELSARSMEKYHAAKEKERREEDDGGGEVDRPMLEKAKSRNFAQSQIELKSADDDEESAFTLKVTKEMDYVSSDLAQSYSSNLAGLRQKFPKIVMYVRKRGSENFVYLTFTFKDCYVVNYHLSLSGGGKDATSIPVETVEFTFSGCAMEYRAQTETGGTRAPKTVGWDFKKRERDDSLAH
jgi:type VI protein secretion system component Hcp